VGTKNPQLLNVGDLGNLGLHINDAAVDRIESLIAYGEPLKIFINWLFTALVFELIPLGTDHKPIAYTTVLWGPEQVTGAPA
jgi:hypothetical protein